MKYVLFCYLLGKKNFLVKSSLAANNKFNITYTQDVEKASKFDSAKEANAFLNNINNHFDRTFYCFPTNKLK